MIRRGFMLFLCLLEPVARAAGPSPLPKATPAEAGFDAAKLEAAAEHAFACAKTGCAVTEALMIVRGGRVVLERYANGYDDAMPHLLWSGSKSVAAALVGVAAKKGLLKIDDPAATYYRPLADAGHDQVRIRDLLHMSSGLGFKETYEKDPFASSVIAMLYGKGRSDMAAFAARHPRLAAPGARWYYSSGDTMLLVAALEGALGGVKVQDFARTELFLPLGIGDAIWETDGQDRPIGSSYLYFTARQAARFGMGFLTDAQGLMQPGWIDFTRTLAPAIPLDSTPKDSLHTQYGAHWWVNTGVPARGVPPTWPSAWPDLFAAWGHWGQLIMVVPSMDLVIVRFGYDRVTEFDVDGFLKRLRSSMEGGA